MTIDQYRAAKERLKNFDKWVSNATRSDAVFRIAVKPSVEIYRPSNYEHTDIRLTHNLVDQAFADSLNTAAIYRTCAKVRADLVAECRRLHIAAANEARGIIAENPPK